MLLQMPRQLQKIECKDDVLKRGVYSVFKNK
jgi:hypothetical protein